MINNNHNHFLFSFGILYLFAIKKEKQIIILVHAKPKNQPGGVQGALLADKYQLLNTASFVINPPMARAAKFKTKNSKSGKNFFKIKLVELDKFFQN